MPQKGRKEMFRRVVFRRLGRAMMLLGAFVVASSGAWAQQQAGNLPWEAPLQTLITSLTGPVAFGIAVVGILACGAGLVFGGEMTEMLRRLLQVGISVCLIVFAVQVLNNWIGFGAEIARLQIIGQDALCALA